MPFKNFLVLLKTHKKYFIPIAILASIIIFLAIPKKPAKIETTKVTKGSVSRVLSVTGKVNAENSVNLSFQIAGKVTYLPFKEGETIEANQTIAALDQRTVQKNIENALLSYSDQRNTFDQTLDNYNADRISDAANDQIKRILQTNQNDLQKAVVSVELQTLAREQSYLVTPISGIITREDVKSVGVNITPSAVFTVTDPNNLSFEMDIDEADIGNITEGQNANLVLDAFPNQTLNLTIGKIDFVSHTTSSGGNAFTASAKLPGDLAYRVGMSGNADIVLNSRFNVTEIPTASLIDDDYVYVKDGSKFHKVKIRKGLEGDETTEVISGVKEGQEVATDPSLVPPKLIK